jgi:hypothetical protein
VRDFPKHAKDWTQSRCDFDVAAKDFFTIPEQPTYARRRLVGRWDMFPKNLEAVRWYKW